MGGGMSVKGKSVDPSLVASFAEVLIGIPECDWIHTNKMLLVRRLQKVNYFI